MGYGDWLHGEAVAAGMVMAADLSQRLGWISAQDVARVRRLIERAGLPVGAARSGQRTRTRTDAPGQEGGRRQDALRAAQAVGQAVVYERRARALLRQTAGGVRAMRLISRLRGCRGTIRAAGRYPEDAAAGPQRIPARPRPHHPLHRVPPPGLQDAGVRQPRRRPVPHPPDPQLEVAQIARSVARRLRLNEDLAEAICLAHDLGHTPFGHAGQDALNECMRDYGGFEHNLQSLRVVDELEERYAAFPGLNLSFESREGILKHCSADNAATLGDVGERFLQAPQPALEAQLANLADEIAYNNHDVDDGLRSGLITLEQLEDRAAVRSATG